MGALAVFFIQGCASPNSPFAIERMDIDQLKTVPTDWLEKTCALSRSKPVVQELSRRGTISKDDEEEIYNDKVTIGMSEAALICAMPKYFALWGHKSETILSGSTITVYTMEQHILDPAITAVVENGKVTSYTIG